MKKILPGLLVLATLCVNAQSKHTPVKKNTTKTTKKADTATAKVEEVVEMVAPAEETVIEAPVVEEVKIGTVDATSTVAEKPNTADGEPFYIYNSYREKNLIIAYQGTEYDNKRYALIEYFSKKKITPFIFESIAGFYDGDLSQVRINSKYGVINSKGQIVVPCIYDEMSNATLDGQTFRIVSKNSRYGMINDQNEVVVPFEYENISKPYYGSSMNVLVTKNGKMGLMNFVSHKLTMPMVYERLYVQSDNLIYAKKGALYSLFNLSGEQMLNNWYTQLDVVSENEMAIAELNGKKGVINFSEKKIIPFEYETITKSRSYYSSRLFFIVQKSGKFGVIGTDGKAILPLQYEQLSQVGNDMILVLKGNKKGLLSIDGKEILPIEYDDITDIDKYFLVRKDNKYGVVNREGSLIVPVEYDALTRVSLAESYNSSFLAATKNGRKGIIDASTGKPRVDFVYDDLIGTRRSSYSSTETFNNSIIATKNGKFGMIEMNGNVLLPFEYDDMQYLNSFLVVVGKGGKYGVVNIYNSSSVLLPFEYLFVSNKNGIIVAYKDGYEKYRLSGSKLIKTEE